MSRIEGEQGQPEQKDDLYQQAAEELAHIQERMGPRFRRAEVRQRAARFLAGLMSKVERKNGWQLAEELGEHGPHGVQRLLAEADWDEEAVRDDLRGYLVEHLGEESAVLATVRGYPPRMRDRHSRPKCSHPRKTKRSSVCPHQKRLLAFATVRSSLSFIAEVCESPRRLVSSGATSMLLSADSQCVMVREIGTALLGMDAAAFSLLSRWLDERKRLHLSRPSVVFCTLDGKPLQASYVRALIPRLARKAGIEMRVHPHGLRHTCAAELAVEGVPVPLIQQQLGHASLHTTTVYLRDIAQVELVERMRQRKWEL